MEIRHAGRTYSLRGWIPSKYKKHETALESVRCFLFDATDTEVPEDTSTLPDRVDLREHFPPVYDQGHIGSCTAQTAAAALEYYQRRWYEQNTGSSWSRTPSRLFIYKHSRILMGTPQGDVGSSIKDTMRALHRFGAPEEDSKFGTEYNPNRFDRDYDVYVYGLADEFSIDSWYNYEEQYRKQGKVLGDLKKHLAAGQPILFGFLVYRKAIEQAADNGFIEPPGADDVLAGGHAVLAVGYDDRKEALVIRNSWGEDWGDGGYGYLSYRYLDLNLASDFWSIVHIPLFSEIDFED